jgi:hypothetical protein
MKQSIRWAVWAALLSFAQATPAQGEEQTAGYQRLWGPVVGVMYVAAPQGEFNDALQQMYPNAERDYQPLLTHFGVNFEQRIRLGNTGSHFAFQEVFTIAGIDQGMALPYFSLLVGFRSRRGPQFGLGPLLLVRWTSEELEIAVSVVYSVGWGFSFHDAYVPLSIAVVPTPRDGHPTFGLFSGFDLVRPARAR